MERQREKRMLTCIGCPLGCQIAVELENGAVVGITGNTCQRGAGYAEKEVTAPARIVTSTVRVANGTLPVVSVKTRGEIPKEKIFECMNALRTVKVTAPIRIGEVLLEDAAGTGIAVVATKEVAAAVIAGGFARVL